MSWIRYTGSAARVLVPRWNIRRGPDGAPGWPRLEPVEVPQEVRDDLVGNGHPEWEDCAAPVVAVLVGEHGPELELPAGEVG